MILSNAALALSAEALAIAFAKGVKHAKRTFLADVKAFAYQVKAPADVAPYAHAPTLAAPFTFRVVLKGDQREALKVYNMSEAHVAKGAAKLLAMDAGAFGRISEGKGKVGDCVALLQLCAFGFERFDSEA